MRFDTWSRMDWWGFATVVMWGAVLLVWPVLALVQLLVADPNFTTSFTEPGPSFFDVGFIAYVVSVPAVAFLTLTLLVVDWVSDRGRYRAGLLVAGVALSVGVTFVVFFVNQILAFLVGYPLLVALFRLG